MYIAEGGCIIIGMGLLAALCSGSPVGLRDDDPSMECIDDCVQGFVSVLERPEVKQTVVCAAYKDGKTCLAQCRGGDAFLEGVAKMAPASFRSIETMCLNPSDTATVDPKALALMNQEQEEMSDMEVCIQGCDAHINDLSSLVNPSLPQICSKWNDYKICVRGCPNGEEIFRMAGKAVPKSMEVLKTYCGSSEEQGDVSRVGPSSAEKEIAKFDCIDSCWKQFEENLLIAGESVQAQCSSYEDAKVCVLACDGGDLFLKKLTKIAPVSTRTMEEQCQDPTSTATMSPTDLRLLTGEEEEATELERCVEACEVHIQGLAEAGQRRSLTAICSKWANYKTCVHECPNGAEIMDMVGQMMPKMLKTINTACPSREVPRLKMSKSNGQ